MKIKDIYIILIRTNLFTKMKFLFTDFNELAAGNKINSDLLKSEFNYEKFMVFINHRLFIDQNLTFDRQMFILNNQWTIEDDYLTIIVDFIKSLPIDEEHRTLLINHVDKLANKFYVINNYSLTRRTFAIYQHDDDDYDEDYDGDDDDNEDDDDDSCDDVDDLENSLLDEYEFQYFVDSVRNMNISN